MNRFLGCSLMTLAVAGMALGQIHARRENQQDRIAQGVQSGRLNAGETARLERQESNINREIHYDRATNGGKLTPGERGLVNHQLNRESRRIYRLKHN